MKTKVLAGVLALGAIFALNGCDSNPTCSGSDVQQLVKEISVEEIEAQVIALYVGQRMSIAELDKLIEQGNGTASESALTGSKLAKTVKDLKIGAIRPNSTDEKTGKIECSARLTFVNGKTADITYTGQYTEDDQLYVEVFGL